MLLKTSRPPLAGSHPADTPCPPVEAASTGHPDKESLMLPAVRPLPPLSPATHHDHGACCCGSPLLQRFHERMMAEISRRHFLGGTAALMALFAGLHSPPSRWGRSHGSARDRCC